MFGFFNFCVAYIFIGFASAMIFSDENSILLSIKKSVIYDPVFLYVKDSMVENPICNFNVSQAGAFDNSDD